MHAVTTEEKRKLFGTHGFFDQLSEGDLDILLSHARTEQHPAKHLKASSPNSLASASGAASSDPSLTCRPPSTAISRSTTMTPSPSCGPNPPTPSSPSSTDCLYLPFESVH